MAQRRTDPADAIHLESRSAQMVVEYIRYVIEADRSAEFEQAYRRASAVLDADPHCLAYEVGRGVEEPGRFVVRIEWDSIEGHEQGFRASPGFGEFFAAVKPFFAQIEEMKHYSISFGKPPAHD
jgi:quinol monooxygenase YgiN